MASGGVSGAAAPTTLQGAAIDLVALREQGRNELLDILQGARGRKALVLDTALRGLLGYIVPEGTKFLRQQGVVHLCRGLQTELSFVTPEGREDEPDHVLYFVRPSIDNMKHIAVQIRERNVRRRPDGTQHRYMLYFVPHKTFICEQVLEDEGVLKNIDVGECQLDIFPFDTDILSLELENSFKDCYVDEDTSVLTTVAKSLLKLEATYGTIPNVKAKGQAAATALHRFMNLKRQAYDPRETPKQSEIDTLIVIDRSTDMITPLLTPLTYEGIIDEFIGIQNGAIKIDASLVGEDGQKDAGGRSAGGRGAPSTPGKDKDGTVTIALNSNDPLYTEIRDLHLEVLGAQLNEKAMEMRQTYARVKEETRDGSLNDIHDVVKSIPALQQKYKGLNLHINIAEFLKPTTANIRFQQKWQIERSMVEGEVRYDDLEDMIASYEPVAQVLRLLCLQSLTSGGLKANKYELLKRELIQSYGYEYLFALNNMEQVGLIRKSDLTVFGTSSGFWSSLRRSLRLVKENVNTQVPDDISYVSSGYAPLSVRLLQLSHKPGWSACQDVLRLVAGPTLEFTQRHERNPDIERIVKAAATASSSLAASSSSSSSTPSTPMTTPASVLTPSNALEAKTLPNGQKVMLVYFIGGVSFMEIAAIRFLSKQKDFPYQIIICTTKLINGNSFILSMVQDIQSQLKTGVGPFSGSNSSSTSGGRGASSRGGGSRSSRGGSR